MASYGAFEPSRFNKSGHLRHTIQMPLSLEIYLTGIRIWEHEQSIAQAAEQAALKLSVYSVLIMHIMFPA